MTRTSIDLPPTENWPAHVLAKTFEEKELCEAIAYLELVRTGDLTPGPELFSLGVDVLDFTTEEIEAVQRKLALAVAYQRRDQPRIHTTIAVAA